MSEKVYCDFCTAEIPKQTAVQVVSQRCSVVIRQGETLMCAKDACSTCADKIRNILFLLDAPRIDRIRDNLMQHR